MTEISAKEFNKRIKTGQYAFDKKGRLKEQELLPEFKQMLDDDTRKSENKKIKGATKCEWNGIKFDSRVERDFYIYLTNNNIFFTTKKTYELQEEFRLEGKAIRPITYTPDFIFDKFVIDVKGFHTQQGDLRIKLFKYKYRLPVYIIKTQREFNKIHEYLKQ